MFAITGTFLPISSNLSIVSLIPDLLAIAIKCIMALVEQPIAIATIIAFSIDFLVTNFEGFKSNQTISTILFPTFEDILI